MDALYANWQGAQYAQENLVNDLYKTGTRISLSRDASSLDGFEYAHLRVGRDDPC